MSYPIFLSVVLVVRNQALSLEAMLTEISSYLSELVSDFELIIVETHLKTIVSRCCKK